MADSASSHLLTSAMDPSCVETTHSPALVHRQLPSCTTSAATRLLPPCSRYVLRGGPQVMQAASAALGLTISTVACRSARRESLAALWLGPDEQLLLMGIDAAHAERAANGISSAPDERDFLRTTACNRGAPTLAAYWDSAASSLTAALAGLPHSLVDVSHRQIAIQVRGAQSELILNVGCPLDLDASRFPVGMCTRTLLGKAQIVLWRTGEDSFHLEVWRSFADYTSGLLAAAARELAW